jgi:hypothetical protein
MNHAQGRIEGHVPIRQIVTDQARQQYEQRTQTFNQGVPNSHQNANGSERKN